MSVQPLGDTPTERVPLCPHCDSEMFPYGALVQEWGLLKWFKAWHCPVHGPVIRYVEKRANSETDKTELEDNLDA